MKSFIKKGLVSAGTFALPFLALAQQGNITTTGASSFNTLFTFVSDFLNNIAGLIVALAFVLFIFGLLKYIRSAGDEKARGEAKNIMIYGVVILFMMVAVWGFVGVLKSSLFGTNSVNVIAPPTIAI